MKTKGSGENLYVLEKKEQKSIYRENFTLLIFSQQAKQNNILSNDVVEITHAMVETCCGSANLGINLTKHRIHQKINSCA